MFHKVQAFMKTFPEKDDETFKPMDQKQCDYSKIGNGLCVLLMCYDFVGTCNTFFLQLFTLLHTLMEIYLFFTAWIWQILRKIL
jgi:hypothetical protein